MVAGLHKSPASFSSRESHRPPMPRGSTVYHWQVSRDGVSDLPWISAQISGEPAVAPVGKAPEAPSSLSKIRWASCPLRTVEVARHKGPKVRGAARKYFPESPTCGSLINRSKMHDSYSCKPCAVLPRTATEDGGWLVERGACCPPVSNRALRALFPPCLSPTRRAEGRGRCPERHVGALALPMP